MRDFTKGAKDLCRRPGFRSQSEAPVRSEKAISILCVPTPPPVSAPGEIRTHTVTLLKRAPPTVGLLEHESVPGETRTPRILGLGQTRLPLRHENMVGSMSHRAGPLIVVPFYDFPVPPVGLEPTLSGLSCQRLLPLGYGGIYKIGSHQPRGHDPLSMASSPVVRPTEPGT
jgi:hypothetical protein